MTMERPAASEVPSGVQHLSADARAILESIGDAFYVLDQDWRFVHVNRRALEFWELPAEAVLGRVIWDCFPALRGSPIEHALRRARDGFSTSLETFSPVARRWIAISLHPFPTGISASWRDISDRVLAEQALRTSEAHLRLAAEAAGIGTWEWDLASGEIRWSPEMFRLLGISPDRDDLYAAWLDAVHPDDRARADATAREHASRAGPCSLEYRLLRPDGEIRWILSRGTTLDDGRGRLVRMFGINIDITERKLAEEAAKEDTERLRLALRAGRLGTWEFDLEQQRGRWSAEVALMHGHPPERHEMSLQEWTALIHPEDLERAVAAFSEAVERRADYSTEYRIIRHDGAVRWTSVHGSVLADSRGTPIRVVGVMQDVTEQRAIEAELRQLNEGLEARVQEEMQAREAAQLQLAQAQRLEALGQLAGGIAHDFNNVLQAVQGALALIARRPEDAEGARRLAQMGMEAAARGASVTRRLLAFSHRGELRAEAIDLPALLADLREMLTPTLGSRIEVRLALAPGLLPVMADKGQLETVLVNLATNARDAMPDGGTLTYAAALETVLVDSPGQAPAPLAPGRYIRLDVSDTGVGMSAATLARASEPFFTTKPMGRGTGLGLAMARGFAEQSGGALRIASEEGRGTTVTLWLPVAAGEAAVAGDSAGSSSQAAPEANPRLRPRVLLVDDDPLVRDTLTGQLDAAGYAVLPAADGPSALTILVAGATVDALVSDLAMPGMDGLAFVREVQRRRPGLPAILLTGYAGDAAALALNGALSGAFTLLRKPITTEQLAERLAALLRQAGAATR
jgi:PAS domain S-box-containing protein